MYTDLLTQLGLAKNEARIYEALLREGECSVGTIAIKSKVHRRNVYDSLQRLIEKGLVFEILEKHENHYQAVEPRKLLELVEEKKTLIKKALPDLEQLFSGTPKTEQVFIYRGSEGWKNYLRDILRIGQPAYFIGAKGGWLDERIKHFFRNSSKKQKRRNSNFIISLSTM